MKATIIAIDFVKDTDGSFKPLELNTNADFHPMSQSMYLDSSKVTDFISNNNITSFEFIGNTGFGSPNIEPGDIVDLEAGEDQGLDTNYGPRALQAIYEEISGSISTNVNNVNPYATTIPYIEDTEDTLIFRNAYDSTALIDTTYAASSVAFLKFVNTHCVGDNALQIPNTFIAPSGSGQTYGEMIGLEPVIDTIDNDNLRDNGVHPNYIIKLDESTVYSDYYNYPQLVKVDTAEQMQALKESLSAEVILQEYILNPDDLVEGRAKTYRMIAALAGPNLEVLDFFTPYSVGNKTPLQAQPDMLGDRVQPWERPAYVQKVNGFSVRPGKFIWNTPLLTSTGADVEFDAVAVDDVISAIDVNGLSDDESNFQWQNWSGSFDSSIATGTITSANVVDINKYDNPVYNLVDVIYYNDNADSIILGNKALILVAEGDNIKFKKAFQLNVGDTLIGVKKNENAQTIPSNVTISDRKVKFMLGSSGAIDIENEDVVGVKGSDGEVLFAVHNETTSGCQCVNCYGYMSGASNCIQDMNACSYGDICMEGYYYCYGYSYTYYDAGCGAGKY